MLLADEEDCERAVLALARVTNAPIPSEDMLRHVSRSIKDAGYTRAQLGAMVRLIPNHAVFSKEINYNGGVTPAVFAQASEDPRARAARLYSHWEVKREFGPEAFSGGEIRPVIVDGKTLFQYRIGGFGHEG